MSSIHISHDDEDNRYRDEVAATYADNNSFIINDDCKDVLTDFPPTPLESERKKQRQEKIFTDKSELQLSDLKDLKSVEDEMNLKIETRINRQARTRSEVNPEQFLKL